MNGLVDGRLGGARFELGDRGACLGERDAGGCGLRLHRGERLMNGLVDGGLGEARFEVCNLSLRCRQLVAGDRHRCGSSVGVLLQDGERLASGLRTRLRGFLGGTTGLMSLVEAVAQRVALELGSRELAGQLIALVGDEHRCGIGEERRRLRLDHRQARARRATGVAGSGTGTAGGGASSRSGRRVSRGSVTGAGSEASNSGESETDSAGGSARGGSCEASNGSPFGRGMR